MIPIVCKRLVSLLLAHGVRKHLVGNIKLTAIDLVAQEIILGFIVVGHAIGQGGTDVILVKGAIGRQIGCRRAGARIAAAIVS